MILLLALVDLPATVLAAPVPFQGAVALLLGGLTLFAGLVLYGVLRRARWSLWCGAGYSLVTLVLGAVALAAPDPAGVGRGSLPSTPLGIAQAALQAVACLAFLAAVAVIITTRRSPRR